MIILLVMNKDKNDTSYVFTQFLNSSGWSSNRLAFCIGLTTPMLGFAGIEMAAHYAEEIQHVQKSLPRASRYSPATTACID
jgi:choline transport protein